MFTDSLRKKFSYISFKFKNYYFRKIILMDINVFLLKTYFLPFSNNLTGIKRIELKRLLVSSRYHSEIGSNSLYLSPYIRLKNRKNLSNSNLGKEFESYMIRMMAMIISLDCLYGNNELSGSLECNEDLWIENMNKVKLIFGDSPEGLGLKFSIMDFFVNKKGIIYSGYMDSFYHVVKGLGMKDYRLALAFEQVSYIYCTVFFLNRYEEFNSICHKPLWNDNLKK